MPFGELEGPLKAMVWVPVNPGKVNPDWSSPVIVTLNGLPAVGLLVAETTLNDVSAGVTMLNGLLVADKTAGLVVSVATNV